MALKKGGLGKGLDAIFMENITESESEKEIVRLRIDEIEPNRDQPRREFDETAMAELADSISQHGVLQPLLVRPLSTGNYQIVAGERRWRACRMAGVLEVPVLIRELSDSEVMEFALIENLQREDLSPIEEAKGYKALMDNHDFTQEELSKSLGKSRPHITNTLRLLNLPEDILNMINEGKISAGHGRALLSLTNEDDMKEIAKIVIEKGISVRELEKLVKKYSASVNKEEKEKKLSKAFTRNSFFDEVEIALNEHLSRKVKVVNKPNTEKGVLEIEYYNEEDLAYIARLLGGTKDDDF